MSARPAPPTGRLMWLIFWISAAVLGFEIVLMRLLLVASWHHFAFLVISIALLGFGASGTLLTLARPVVMRHGGGVLFALTLATAVSMPLCAGIAQHVPIEARFVPALLWEQVGWWVLYWALLGVPFLLGAAAIGAALMIAARRIPLIYGGNLMGSAAGAIAAPVAMMIAPPEWLPSLMTIPALLGAAALTRRYGLAGRLVWLLAMAIIAAFVYIDRPAVRLDPYKYGAYVQRLVDQDAAVRTARQFGPRGDVRAYESAVLHDLPFLSTGEAPPPLAVITIDGHWAGSVLRVETAEEASVVDRTLMSFPYELAPQHPRVALLGEIGGANVWLARRRDAGGIDAVQPYAAVRALMLGPLAGDGGSVLARPSANLILAEPRHHIETTPQRYDLIQLVKLESSAAGSGGVGGMGQDHTITVEGVESMLDRLAEGGMLFVCRGIQTPPRDNIKLLATFIEALRRLDIATPQRHIVIVRDYLAVCTIVKRSPFSALEIERIRDVCGQRQLTPVWFEGIRTDELNQPDALPAPADGVGDWYHYAARQLFSPRAQRFIDEWAFDIRPPTDDRPFFFDFCRLDSIGALREAFGDLWLTRAEIAFLFVLVAMMVIAVIGAVLTIAPLLLLRTARRSRGRWATVVYFAAIGLAYLLLEMTFLSRLTLWIGDPVVTAAVTIAGFLVLSGLGSLTAQRLGTRGGRVLAGLVAILILIGAVNVSMLPKAVGLVASFPEWGRCLAALVAVAPLGYLMGFPMPMGLSRVDRGAAALLPWAWGVNGFASVLAAPLATAVGMTWGFSVAAFIALVLYGVAGLVFAGLPRAAGDRA
ncbi:MAG: hypothetical protein SYC29_17930 [Planctomycetota bacterium]|nr:hypothetical protein [Planctomycetota bacterium]